MNLFTNNESKCEKNIDLLNILSEIIKTNKSYILRGGLAIALYYKKIYRCHKDIDLYLDLKDFSFWQSFFSKEYIFKKVQIPTHCPEIMYALYKKSEHIGHIVFINNLNDNKNILSQIYRQKRYEGVWPNELIEKYSKFIPIKEEDKIKALQIETNPVIKIQIDHKQINVLDIKYLKEQKIFGILYRGKEEDQDMKYYFNCVI